MHGYFDEGPSVHTGVLNEIAALSPTDMSSCPVIPSEGIWETVSDPTRFQKKFEIPSQQELVAFVNEVLAYQNNVQHHGKITVDANSVMIEVYTHDVNTVTEIDQEYIHEVDNIFLDVKYSGLNVPGNEGY